MDEFKSMYTRLSNAITDAIEVLKTAQVETEEMFMLQEGPDIIVLDQPNE